MKKLFILSVVVIALGLSVYVLSRQKAAAPATSPMVHSFTITDEKSFLENMIPHHQEAVDTSVIIESQAQDTELKQFSKGVIEAQSSEIAQMNAWYRSWYSLEYTSDSNYEPMMSDLGEYKGAAQEKAYVEGMIRHHQGAIEMAKKVLGLNIREEVKQFAESIISAQESEVIVLEQWLETKYAKTPGENKTLHDVQVH